MKPVRLLRVFLPAFAGLLLLFSSSCAKDEPKIKATRFPFLWRVEKETPAYFFGTVHLPDPRVLALHREVTRAFDLADSVYVEIPMDASSQLRILEGSILPEGQNLKDILPADLYRRSDAYLQPRGLSMQAFGRFQIWKLAADLMLLEGMSGQSGEAAMDMTFYLDAQAQGKEAGGIESLEEQLSVFQSFTQEEQIRMLDETLTTLEEYSGKEVPLLEELVQAYLSGSEAEVERLFDIYSDDDPLSEKFEQVLVRERNLRMAERAARLMEKNPDKRYFFAFGAAHFHGAYGIPEILRKKGFSVRRLHPPQ